MRNFLIIFFCLGFTFSFSQEVEVKDKLALKKANDYVFEGNQLTDKDAFVEAEMAYRKAISENPSNAIGAYNLANSYYSKGSFDEALYRQQEVVNTSTSKDEKHKAFHNIGNILMKNKKCKEAVEAYKNALRNDPTDEETRYNLGLAKECAEQQEQNQDQNQDDNKDQKDENKDNQDQKDKDQEGDNKEDQKDKGDQDKKEGEDEQDENGKPKEDKKEENKEGDQKKEQQKPQPQKGKLSDQQIKSLLEAMNNQEQKVQEKLNAQKQKGVKVKTEKDW